MKLQAYETGTQQFDLMYDTMQRAFPTMNVVKNHNQNFLCFYFVLHSYTPELRS